MDQAMKYRYLLADVDGTLIDALANQREVWRNWAAHFGLEPDAVHAVALRTRPTETFSEVAPHLSQEACLQLLHELEDADVESGNYVAFAGASRLLRTLVPSSWAIVTSNYRHRVHRRFEITGLPIPKVIVDADAVHTGKPSPEPFLRAAELLGASPSECLVLEDTASGVEAASRAGMTVWTVNSATAPAGTHRHFETLDEAVPLVLLSLDSESLRIELWQQR